MRMYLACSLILSFVSIFAKHVSSAALPVWAKIREQCPETGNKTAWMMAASKLDCLHSGDSRFPSEQKRVYHCLPSNLLNEYVEFCGINAPVEPGYCPVFKYINTNGRNRGPSYMNCSAFQSGCPEEQYFSRNVHKYPECLAINKNYMCYTADLSCPKVVFRENTTILMDVLTSSISSTTDTGVKIDSDEMTDTIDEWIIALLILTSLACTGAVFMCICVFVKRRRRRRVFKGKGIDAETLLKEMSERDEDQSHDEETPFIVRQEIRGVQLKKLLYKIANTLGKSDVEKLQKFLQSSDRKDSEDKNTKIRNMDKFELLDYMDKIFHLDLNIYILQGFLENIRKGKLAEKCIKFAQNSNNPLNYYVPERCFLVSGFTKIFFKLAREIDNYSRQEAETLVKELQHLLNARRDQIILYGLSEGCILLHLAVKDTLIPTLRTSNLRILQKYKVFKISILEECIYYCYDVDLQHQCNSKGNYSLYPSKDSSTFYTSLTEGEHMKVEKEKGREMYEVGALETIPNESTNIKRYLIPSEECLREQQITEKIDKEYLKFWLKSVGTYCDKDTPVIFVGTHSNKIGFQNPTVLFDSVKDHLQFDNHLNVNFSRDSCFVLGSETSEIYFSLKLWEIEKSIFSMVVEDRWKKTIPTTWAAFEVVVRELKRKKKRMRSVKEILFACIGEMKQKCTKFEHVLEYFYGVGGILCIIQEPILGEIVILDIPWFLNAIENITSRLTAKSAITIHTHSYKRNHPVVDLQYRMGRGRNLETNLCNKGVEKAIILQYMQRHGPLVLGENACYVPCINKRNFRITGAQKIQSLESRTSVLVFRFQNFPHFYFCRLVAACMVRTNWRVVEGKDLLLYKNVGFFYHKQHLIVMAVNNSSIQIQLFRPSNDVIIREVSLEVRDTIEQILNELIGSYQEKIGYSVGYQCSKQEVFCELDDCFVKENDIFGKKEIPCPRHGMLINHTLKESVLLHYWKPGFSSTSKMTNTLSITIARLQELLHYWKRDKEEICHRISNQFNVPEESRVRIIWSSKVDVDPWSTMDDMSRYITSRRYELLHEVKDEIQLYSMEVADETSNTRAIIWPLDRALKQDVMTLIQETT